MTSKYDSIRRLNELDLSRQAGEWTDTMVLPPLLPMTEDTADTVPMLPALLRPQA